MIDVLKGWSSAVLHTYPQFVPPQVGPKVLDDVGVPAVFHHQDFLLDNPEVVPRLKFDHLDGSQLLLLGSAAVSAICGQKMELVSTVVRRHSNFLLSSLKPYRPGFFLTSAAEKTKTQGQNSSKKLKEKKPASRSHLTPICKNSRKKLIF